MFLMSISAAFDGYAALRERVNLASSALDDWLRVYDSRKSGWRDTCERSSDVYTVIPLIVGHRVKRNILLGGIR
jgi:hypothetical protein